MVEVVVIVVVFDSVHKMYLLFAVSIFTTELQ